jgi:hypothetical protein
MPQPTTRSRGDLKTFFVKNAIPTESNFADLIDGMLNQRDDGIAKLPNDALMIVAAGDATSQKKAIHFYAAAGDTDPSWTLGLNPRQNPADAATAKPGFSISDGAGNSRLFVERTTGRIGVGTVGPLQAALHIDRGAANDPAVMLSSSGPGWGSGLQLKNTAAGAARTYGIYAGGGTLHFADVDASADRLVISPDAVFVPGKLTIGVSTPVSDLTLRRDAAGALGPAITLMNAAGSPGAGGALDFDGYNVGPNLPTARLQSLDDGSFSSHLVFSTKNPGAAANPLAERMRIASNGTVSFTAAITPSTGNLSTRGIQFPANPGLGSGDEAFIRYYAVAGEDCKLMIGINNDPNDTLGLWQAGAERLTVGYGWLDVVADGNPVRFTSAWSGSPDGAGVTNRAEISNDTGTYKTLMIIGNKSAGLKRRVSVWDRLEVNGLLTVTEAITPSAGNSSARGIQFPSDPGLGGGDEAFIRYYPVSGETCKLLIGINNDPDDTIGFWQAGGERMTVVFGGVKVNGFISGGETTTGWTLGSGGTTDNWLRLTKTPGSSPYHDLAVGKLYAGGAGRFDLAEVTPVRADDQLEQGDIVVIDREDGMRVRRSARAFDPTVYGVVSSYAQAAMVIGGFGGPEQMMHAIDKLPIALVGRVKIKVCSEAGPIRVGDLLTSSSRPGHAMRCADPAAHPGAIAGKALEPFSGDTGTVTALVTLQ